jgi:hypothetical protein
VTSWIHLDDWVAMVEWAIATAPFSGPLNLTCAEPGDQRGARACARRDAAAILHAGACPAPSAWRSARWRRAASAHGRQRVGAHEALALGFTSRLSSDRRGARSDLQRDRARIALRTEAIGGWGSGRVTQAVRPPRQPHGPHIRRDAPALCGRDSPRARHRPASTPGSPSFSPRQARGLPHRHPALLARRSPAAPEAADSGLAVATLVKARDVPPPGVARRPRPVRPPCSQPRATRPETSAPPFRERDFDAGARLVAGAKRDRVVGGVHAVDVHRLEYSAWGVHRKPHRAIQVRDLEGSIGGPRALPRSAEGERSRSEGSASRSPPEVRWRRDSVRDDASRLTDDPVIVAMNTGTTSSVMPWPGPYRTRGPPQAEAPGPPGRGRCRASRRFRSPGHWPGAHSLPEAHSGIRTPRRSPAWNEAPESVLRNDR